MRLWEVKHPYYMHEGNFYSRGCHTDFESAEELISEWGDSDMDYNYVVRWDWLEGDLKDYSGDDDEIIGSFKIQIVGQRKALLLSAACPVCRNDEPALRKFLEPRAAYVAEMWQPFALTPSNT
jgi:hypothetical protein